jgi:hypothetical protein
VLQSLSWHYARCLPIRKEDLHDIQNVIQRYIWQTEPDQDCRGSIPHAQTYRTTCEGGLNIMYFPGLLFFTVLPFLSWSFLNSDLHLFCLCSPSWISFLSFFLHLTFNTITTPLIVAFLLLCLTSTASVFLCLCHGDFTVRICLSQLLFLILGLPMGGC